MFDAPHSANIAADISTAPVAAPVSLDRLRIGKSGVARQQTLRMPISCTGVGLHSGSTVSMTLRPAEPNSGIRFRRIDVQGKDQVIPALWSSVSDTRLNTCISNADGVYVRTIEHLMSALAGLGIDNALIDIDGEEVPVMDGSAAPFVFLIECAGLTAQSAPRKVIKLLKRIVVQDGDKIAMLTPADDFRLSVGIDFAASAIGHQEVTFSLDAAAFKADISRARTFGFEQEVEAMRAAGLGRGGSLDNAVVIAGDGRSVLNEDGLRYDDEFVRHKLLDALGDLSLAGAPLQAHFSGIRTGHALNNRLLRALFADSSAWIQVPQGVQGSLSMPLNARRVAAAAM